MQGPCQILAGIRAIFGNLFAGEGELPVLDTDGDGGKVRHGLEKEAFGDFVFHQVLDGAADGAGTQGGIVVVG